MKNIKNNVLLYLLGWYLSVGVILYAFGFYLFDLDKDTRSYLLMYLCYYICMFVPGYTLYSIVSFIFHRSILFVVKKRLVKPSFAKNFRAIFCIIFAILAYSHFIYLYFFRY